MSRLQRLGEQVSALRTECDALIENLDERSSNLEELYWDAEVLMKELRSDWSYMYDGCVEVLGYWDFGMLDSVSDHLSEANQRIIGLAAVAESAKEIAQKWLDQTVTG